MASLEYLLGRAATEVKCVRKVIDDTPVVLRIEHVGTGTTQTPTVVLSDTSSTLTLTDGAAAATAIDLSLAAYSTVGEVADYINGLASWECKVLDALRSDNSNDMWINGSITSASKNGETVFDILQDTQNIGEYKVRVAYEERVTPLKAQGSHVVTLDSISYYADLTAAGMGVRVYEYDPSGMTETLIWSYPSTDTTQVLFSGKMESATNIYPFAPITADDGKELVVVITGTVVDAASLGFLQADFTRK